MGGIMTPVQDGDEGYLVGLCNRKYVRRRPDDRLVADVDRNMATRFPFRESLTPGAGIFTIDPQNFGTMLWHIWVDDGAAVTAQGHGHTGTNPIHFRLSPNNYRHTISIQVAAKAGVFLGNFVCAEDGGSSPLKANRQAVGAWEQFMVFRADDV